MRSAGRSVLHAANLIALGADGPGLRCAAARW